MLITTTELQGRPVLALDAPVGRVEDFLFDDKNWVVRYLVVRTGSWLSNDLFLLSPHVLGPLAAGAGAVRVRLLKRQIEASPPLEAPLQVSRRYEEAYYRHFSLPEYWSGSALWGQSSQPLISPGPRSAQDSKLHCHREEGHLRSAHALAGFHLLTAGASAGRVKGFEINLSGWEIQHLVVRPSHWFASREVLVAPTKIDFIGYEDAIVHTSLPREDLQGSTGPRRADSPARAAARGLTQP